MVKCLEKSKNLFDKSAEIHGKLEGKIGGAFTSSGGVACGAETTILPIVNALLIHGMIIQGRADIEHYGAASVGSPKERDTKSCQELGKLVADLAFKLKA